MSKRPIEPDDGTSAKLSRWDIKELRLSSTDGRLSSILPRIQEDLEFKKWLDDLRQNRGAKFFVKEINHRMVVIGIRSHWVMSDRKTLQIDLEVRSGAALLDQWANSET